MCGFGTPKIVKYSDDELIMATDDSLAKYCIKTGDEIFRVTADFSKQGSSRCAADEDYFIVTSKYIIYAYHENMQVFSTLDGKKLYDTNFDFVVRSFKRANDMFLVAGEVFQSESDNNVTETDDKDFASDKDKYTYQQNDYYLLKFNTENEQLTHTLEKLDEMSNAYPNKYVGKIIENKVFLVCTNKNKDDCFSSVEGIKVFELFNDFTCKQLYEIMPSKKYFGVMVKVPYALFLNLSEYEADLYKDEHFVGTITINKDEVNTGTLPNIDLLSDHILINWSDIVFKYDYNCNKLSLEKVDDSNDADIYRNITGNIYFKCELPEGKHLVYCTNGFFYDCERNFYIVTKDGKLTKPTDVELSV